LQSHADMHTDSGLVVASRAMTELLSMAERAAQSPAKVLITGESGVGKDLVARFIHSRSADSQRRSWR
jgi:DNA-binding NtrC family response regulator